MGCKLVGWLGIKNSITFAYRAEEKYMSLLDRSKEGGRDLDILGSLFAALPIYTKSLVDCEPQSITFFNDLESEGLSFKYASHPQNPKLLSIAFEEVKPTVDFINLKGTAALDLIKLLYEEGKQKLDNFNGYVTYFFEKINEGRFNEMYNKLCSEEYEGNTKYDSKALTIYSYVDKRGTNTSLANTETGSDLEQYCLTAGRFDEEQEKINLFNVITTVRNLYTELFYNNKMPDEGISFTTMTNEENIYVIVEYKKISKDKNKQDCFGILLRLVEDEKEKELKKIIKDSFMYLEEFLEIYKWAIDESEYTLKDLKRIFGTKDISKYPQR